MYWRSSRSFRRASLELKPAPPVIIGRANSRLLGIRYASCRRLAFAEGDALALWNSENSKANRIETMKGPAESGQICSVGRRKIAKKIAKNKRCYCQNLATPLKDAVEGDEGGLRGSLPPWVILGGGVGESLSPGSILPLRGTGDAASGLLAEKRHHRRCREPGNFAARVLVGRRPGSWIAEWMDRRVVRELSLLLVTLPPPNFAPPLIAFQQHP